ncbi:archaea-specific SMC-related protein [Halogeometricum borinquense]|uniref:archaea-specific SMC-related protein n=1 Tax=Halogeometricum borinquense TaxID=60847 RepID=UPI00343DAE72
MAETQRDTTAQVDVENIGGIEDADVQFQQGITVLTGRNATNRTSFLRSIAAGLGSDDVSLKSDADSGHVELKIDGESYTRSLTQNRGTITFDGDPYLEDSTIADLFAFLLGSNEARRAVVAGADLREILMRPVDTVAIESEIQSLKSERDQIDSEIKQLSSVEDEIHNLEQRRNSIKETIEELADKRDELTAEIEAEDRSLSEQTENKAELDEILEKLQAARSDLKSVRFRLESERESIESLRDERTETSDELDALSEADYETKQIESQIEQTRGRIDELNRTITDLQTIIEYNSDVLAGKSDVVADALDEDSAGSVTDQLVDSTITCWTCGTNVEQSQVEQTTDRLRSLRDEHRERREELRNRLEELDSELREVNEQERRQEELTNRLSRLEDEIEERTATVEELQDERDELQEQVEALESEADELRDQTQTELIERHKQRNEYEFKLDQKRDELEDITAELEEKQDELERREELKQRREQVKEQLAETRSRIESIETNAIEAFNEEMETVLNLLDYENIDRVWIERKNIGSGKSNRNSQSAFELHIVRTNESGAVYEDTIDNLSESEREVIGLVFALAGYLVHEVHDTVPFMLLDSVEAIDSERISELVEYFSQFPDYLVVALLPEDAEALDEQHQYIEW